ncbi:DUF7310 family coiled-coil domain-containing protein [Halorubrum sp. DTA98]|uniref:DUF7310 family coiled-coil domain-containing protein n=1 Tax=Halorubrum sp. DTA98 TaxID=3402163 RepID=UPI003AB05C67
MSDDASETLSDRTDTPTDADRIHERLRAVERALTGDDRPAADLSDDATAAAEREALDDRLSDIEARVEELEAATQALRGYVGSIRAVNREVERRADLALATATDARGDGGHAPVGDGGHSLDGDGGHSHDDGGFDRGRDTTSEGDPAVVAAVPDGRANGTESEIDDLCVGSIGSVSESPAPDSRTDDTDDRSASKGDGADRDVIARLREVL